MEGDLYAVCELTPEQQRAFNRLKKAYKDCEKAGIYFANNYGDLMAFNKKLVAGYGDMTMHADGEYEVVLDNGCPAESMRIANEWADDTHVLGLTKKGMKLYLQEED
jgi:hypothetical protein